MRTPITSEELQHPGKLKNSHIETGKKNCFTLPMITPPPSQHSLMAGEKLTAS